MRYFKNVKTVTELKKLYKRLARENHPDMGGDVEIMKAINAEFDIMIATLPTDTRTEINTFRSEFYTQNGWKGSNYDSNLSLKEIAQKVREFCKAVYPECKFSITTEYASNCCELNVALMESPYRLNKTVEELTYDELYNNHYSYNYQYGHSTTEQKKKAFLKNCFTEEINDIIKTVDSFVNSYRYSDCDGQIDYFYNNFYYFECKCGKWNKDYVQNESRISKKRKPLVTV